MLSDFNNFTPIVADRVEGWRVDGDECSFSAKGFSVTLTMVERVEPNLVKIQVSPFDLTAWLQLKEVDGNVDGELPDTRMRIVVRAEMNVMVKMMIGSKIQSAIDALAAQIAAAFNS